MKYQIEHTNTFCYDAPVDQSLNDIRLKPLTDECQRLLYYRTDIEPSSITREHTDHWGNSVETFFLAEKHDTLVVKTTSVVSIQRSPFIYQLAYTDEMRNIFESGFFRSHYLHYLNETFYTQIPVSMYQSILTELNDNDNPISFSINLMSYINRYYRYDTSATTVNSTAREVVNLRAGVCQDFTHVMLGVLRHKGIPARYISGYLHVPEDSGLIGDLASHAWVEVMIPGIGWVGLDPTNNMEALQQHIRVGKGRDYDDISPLKGVYRGGTSTLDVKVSVSVIEH